MFFPRRGELCPVEKVSYKGYSPPKCTCNDIIHEIIHTHSYKICISLYECLCHAPFPESSPTPTHMQLSCMKTVFKTNFFFLNPQDHLRVSNHWTTSKYQTIGPPPSINHWTISKNPLLDNPLIEFIRKTFNIIYWTTLRITVTG